VTLYEVLGIAVLLLCFVSGGVAVCLELHDAKEAARHLPVDIDRYTRATRARRASPDEVQEAYERLGLLREERARDGR
jgi:hypothetical protein